MKNRRPITRGARRDRVRHLFDCWPEIVLRIKSAGHLTLFLDFDGTLTPLRARPEDVLPLDLKTRGLLRRLASHRRLDLCMISGRRLSDLKSLVHAPGVRLFGLYGSVGPGVPPMRKERKLVQRVKRMLAAGLPKTHQIRIEDKSLGLAVHYRGAMPNAVRAARQMVLEILERFKPQIHLFEGKKVWELFPWKVGGKGAAVRRLLAKRRRPTLPIFVGDDAADESAFAALPHGITVHVGNTHRTQADLYLRSPGEVLAFLERLEAEIA